MNELSRLYLAYGSASALESVALKATIVLPILLLQKPSKTSTKGHIACLEKRLSLWSNGELMELVKEGRALQQRLPPRGAPKLARSFSNLMFAGKCKAALDLLSNADKGGLLHLNDPVNPDDPSSLSVKDVLISKHPPAQPVHHDCVLPEDPQEPHPIIFDSIDANAIRSAALRVNGAAGPLGLDAHEWRRLCQSHKGASRDLCAALASVTSRLCSLYVHPSLVAPLLACHLIALNKNPGARPIRIGDTARRIIAKAVHFIAASDIQNAAGCLQLCDSQMSGIEAAVHATRSAFESDNVEAVLLVDATNAFNCINRQVALQNIRHLCPTIATILINSYRSNIDLFVDGEVIPSQEGTTQGDPLAMAMYGLATIPLIRKLDGICKQIWYADDSAACGSIDRLRGWWNQLSAESPDFGYFPNPSKTWLVTKESHLENVTDIFAGSGVNVTSSGR